MQQRGSQYGMSPEMPSFAATGTSTRSHMLGVSSSDHLQQQKSGGDSTAVVAEAASPISSRPPAARSSGNFDELVPVSVSVSGGYPDDDGLGGEEADRGGVSGGNRWPRQETIALLKIRSDMDAAFRDATLKGPLWEDVSRKLAELGYSRSGRKCKEKFENVHKYYKRTKEGRAGRQDGKTYRFFSQLEALHSGTNLPSSATASVSMTMGMVGSSARIQPLNSDSSNPNNTTTTHVVGVPRISPPPDLSGGGGAHTTPIAATTATANTAGISFSSDTSSDSEDELEQGPSNTNTRKRKRGSSGGGSSSSGKNKMMAFFEGLMKQVMEKQEAMQQRFLDTIDKREQDRLIREEAWKRQEMARLTHEHEIIAQERAISASRDAAIIAFLQKITGQTIQLPPPIVIPAAPPPKSTPPPPPPPPQPQPQPQIHQLQQQQHHQQPQNKEIIRHQPTSSEVVVAAVPEQQYPPQEMGGGSCGFDPTSSRWPKVEVLALIKLRSGLDSRYQEAGPKGPLWEEISAGMQRMGYNRSAKRCKEKWENINKYFKKVKESNKKRPEDAKTCPYFHQLDALYRKKMSSSSSSTNLIGNQSQQEQQLMDSSSTIDPTSTEKLQAIVITPQPPPQTQTGEAENNNGGNMEMKNSSNEGLFEEGGTTGLMKKVSIFSHPLMNKKLHILFHASVNWMIAGGLILVFVLKPEDIMKELMMEHHHPQLSVMDAYDKLEEPQSSDINLDQDEDDEDDEDDDDEEVEEENGKMDYKIQFQRQNTAGSSNGGGNTGGGSFLAMVQ